MRFSLHENDEGVETGERSGESRSGLLWVTRPFAFGTDRHADR